MGGGGNGRAGAWAALAGVVCAAVGFAVAELVAALVGPGSSPLFAAGAGVVDAVPGPVKDWAVATFGTADKAVLLGGMGVVLAAGAALAGGLELRRPPWGSLLLGAVGAVGAVVAATRPGASVAWALPSLVGVGVAILLLRASLAPLRGPLVLTNRRSEAGASIRSSSSVRDAPGITSRSASPLSCWYFELHMTSRLLASHNTKDSLMFSIAVRRRKSAASERSARWRCSVTSTAMPIN